MMKTYLFYTDPSHGWLKVPKYELIELGIDNQISHCSYMRGDYAYLEEDRDAGIFILAVGRENIRFKEMFTNKQSKIRSYEIYDASK